MLFVLKLSILGAPTVLLLQVEKFALCAGIYVAMLTLLELLFGEAMVLFCYLLPLASCWLTLILGCSCESRTGLDCGSWYLWAGSC